MKRPLAATVRRLAVVLAAVAGLSGCAGVLVGGGAAVGTAAYSERGVDGAARDVKIGTTIYARFFDFSQDLAIKIGTEVYDGRVLLTGVASSEQMRADAVRIAWTVGGVKDVLNEIQLAGGGGMELARDSWITTQLKTKITFDKEIMAVNYSIETVNRTIYLIGLAQSQAELDRVMAHARAIEYVQDVVSHVKIKGAS
ncbi:MAG: BON domain-containing protein [Ochrobactrum anthropi]|uniref:BON domain-containing protein n=1 Tax=Brucella anthropi TaxID=529 RepID=A0A8I0TAT3_BRUAN|nr:BON domain-containing protein [Brucella anthropi]MBE0562770.1 BON domain-containing protein [Brucella anthropi]